jgi:putative hydrolase of the HAD superfamily
MGLMDSGHNDQPRGVIFDGDDTLWRTESLYDEARAAARAALGESAEIGARWEELQRRIDVENVAILGFSSERFPTSCVQAYQQLSEHSVVYDATVAAAVRNAAAQVFNRDPELVPGAHETLNALRVDGTRLALLTKGDLGVQRRRVITSGLEKYFDLVRIVSEKSPDTIRTIAAELRVPLRNAWMVGNSVRSDVMPALEAGIRAIWIEAHVWEYERAHDHLVDERVVVVSAITDVPAAISSTDPARGSRD